MTHSSTKSSLTSPGKEVCLPTNETSSIFYYFQSRSPSVPTNGRLMTIHQEQLTVIIRRAPNTGLGISIAGGIGSTPYKDNDYVRKAPPCFFI